MSLNFKNTALLILILCGFLFFFLNAIELNYKNFKFPKSEQISKSASNLNDKPNKVQVEADNLINKFSENVKQPKYKETPIQNPKNFVLIRSLVFEHLALFFLLQD